MARKKLSEMTPIERVDQRMKGMTWEEAESVGVEILTRCLALHMYARKDGADWFDKTSKRIIKRAQEWKDEGDNSRILAWAAVAHKREQNKEKGEKSYEQPMS